MQLGARWGRPGCRNAAPEGLSLSRAKTALLYREKPQQPRKPSNAGAAREYRIPSPPPGGSLPLPLATGAWPGVAGIGAPGTSASGVVTQHVDVSDAQARAAPPSLSECRPGRGGGRGGRAPEGEATRGVVVGRGPDRDRGWGCGSLGRAEVLAGRWEAAEAVRGSPRPDFRSRAP